MIAIMECAKLGLFVLALLTGCIFALEGCASQNVLVIDDDAKCVIAGTELNLLGNKAVYEQIKIDCLNRDEKEADGAE